jgi:phage terminase large subunit
MSIQIEESKTQTGTIHHLTRKAYESGVKTVIHKGGTGSGKTFDLMIFNMFYYALKNPGSISTTVSESKPHLDIGAIRYAKKFATSETFADKLKYNESKSFYTFPNGSIVEFFSADRIDKALGARRGLLYGNEINSLKKEVWSELARRSEFVMGDFNPTAQFWLEDWLEYEQNYQIFTSNHWDNPFLPETERQKIIYRAERDTNFKRIHIDCEYGVYDGLVFTEWQQIDVMPEGNIKYGLDFGYTNDPSVLVGIIETHDSYYVDEIIYRTGLLNKDIASLMGANGIKPNYDEIIADSSEPKSIDEIRRFGYNVLPAMKGPDSIVHGINKIKSKKLFVTKRSVNLIKELREYSYITDKEGKTTNKPIDAFNHGIDAVRYALSNERRPKQARATPNPGRNAI